MEYSVLSVFRSQQPQILSEDGSVVSTTLAARPVPRWAQAMPGLGMPESGPYLPVPSSMVRSTADPGLVTGTPAIVVQLPCAEYSAWPVKASAIPYWPTGCGQPTAPLRVDIMLVSDHLSCAAGLLRYTEPGKEQGVGDVCIGS